MVKKELCTHPLDGRARLLDVQDHQQIIIERCTKCMRPEWVLEGREGIDYPKKFTQEEVDIKVGMWEKLLDATLLKHKIDLNQLQKEILDLFDEDQPHTILFIQNIFNEFKSQSNLDKDFIISPDSTSSKSGRDTLKGYRKDIGNIPKFSNRNHYIIVNQDEPYAERVWEVILEGERVKMGKCRIMNCGQSANPRGLCNDCEQEIKATKKLG